MSWRRSSIPTAGTRPGTNGLAAPPLVSSGAADSFCRGRWPSAREPPSGSIRTRAGSHRDARGWDREAAGGSLGFNEIYDARKDPPDWAAADFDDSAWLPASVLRVAGFHFSDDVVPFPAVFERDIPPLATRTLRPQAIAATAELGENTIYKLLDCSLERPEALLAEAGEAAVRTTESRDLLLVLDFGRIVFGSPRLELEASAGAAIDLTHGDELELDGRVRPTPGVPGFDAPPESRYTTREGRQSWERFEPAGFRYLQATFRGVTGPLKVGAIRVEERLYPAPFAGRFRCSDELLNQIWEAGARTLSLCMHDAYVDCPTREQRQWVADASLEALVNYAVFGDAALAARFLRQVAQAQRSDGRTSMCAPGDFSAADFLSIPDFTLAWILAVDRHDLYTQDSGLARELLPSVGRALTWFEQWFDADGLLAHVPGWVFLDWAEHDKRGQVTALNAAFVAALRAAARLAGLDSGTGEAERLDRLADGVAAAINERLWDEHREVYVDARRGTVPGRRVSQLANAAVIAYGIAPAQRWPRILSAILDPERVTRTRRRPRERARAFDEEFQVIEAQPYGSHLVHRALAAGGRHGALLDTSARDGARCSNPDPPSGRPGRPRAGTAAATDTPRRPPSSSRARSWACLRSLRASRVFASLRIRPVSSGRRERFRPRAVRSAFRGRRPAAAASSWQSTCRKAAGRKSFFRKPIAGRRARSRSTAPPRRTAATCRPSGRENIACWP